MLNTKKKYLKYKQKYLNLKKMIGGGIDANYKKNDDILTLTYRIDDYNKEIKYRIIDKLGEGNYGIVYKIIKDGDTKNTFIFKEGIRNDYQSYKEGINSNLLKNILDDDMLVLFQGKYESDFLISTYNGNDLLKEFKKNKQQIKKKYANTTTQLLELLHTINKNNIFHNDIKLENITIKDDKVYLIDFGFLTQLKSNMGTLTSMSYNGVITLLTVYNFNAYYEEFPELKTFLKDTDIVGFFYCCIDLLFLTETDDYSSFNILHSLNISTYEEDDIYRLFDLFYFILPESKSIIKIMEEPDYSKYDKKLPSKDTAKSIFGNFPDENTNLFRFMAYIYYKIKLYLIKNQTQQIWYKDFLKIMSACFLPDFNYDEFKKDFENIVSTFSELPEIQEAGFGSDSIPSISEVYKMLSDGVPEPIPESLSGMLQSEIDIINIIFPESDFKKTYHDDEIRISGSGLDTTVCLNFLIRPDDIHILSLHNCAHNTGTILLEKINILAQRLNIESISLIDASTIYECSKRISLSTIKILTKGESWYNSLGYKSTNYEDEVKHNNKIINMPYSEFKKQLLILYIEQLKNINSQEILKSIQRFIKRDIDRLNELEKSGQDNRLLKIKEAEYETYQKQIDDYSTFIYTLISKKEKEYKELIDTTIFSDIDVESNVQKYFNSIWSQIKRNNCNETIIKQLDWLLNIISIINTSKILQYNNELIKTVIQESPAIQNKYLKYKQKYLNLKN